MIKNDYRIGRWNDFMFLNSVGDKIRYIEIGRLIKDLFEKVYRYYF